MEIPLGRSAFFKLLLLVTLVATIECLPSSKRVRRTEEAREFLQYLGSSQSYQSNEITGSSDGLPQVGFNIRAIFGELSELLSGLFGLRDSGDTETLGLMYGLRDSGDTGDFENSYVDFENVYELARKRDEYKLKLDVEIELTEEAKESLFMDPNALKGQKGYLEYHVHSIYGDDSELLSPMFVQKLIDPSVFRNYIETVNGTFCDETGTEETSENTIDNIGQYETFLTKFETDKSDQIIVRYHFEESKLGKVSILIESPKHPGVSLEISQYAELIGEWRSDELRFQYRNLIDEKIKENNPGIFGNVKGHGYMDYILHCKNAQEAVDNLPMWVQSVIHPEHNDEIITSVSGGGSFGRKIVLLNAEGQAVARFQVSFIALVETKADYKKLLQEQFTYEGNIKVIARIHFQDGKFDWASLQLKADSIDPEVLTFQSKPSSNFVNVTTMNVRPVVMDYDILSVLNGNQNYLSPAESELMTAEQAAAKEGQDPVAEPEPQSSDVLERGEDDTPSKK